MGGGRTVHLVVYRMCIVVLNFPHFHKWIHTETKIQRYRENNQDVIMIDNHTGILFDEASQTHRASHSKSNYNPNDIPMLWSYCKDVCRPLYLPLLPGKEI